MVKRDRVAVKIRVLDTASGLVDIFIELRNTHESLQS